MALFRNTDALESEEPLGLDRSDCEETYTPVVTVPLLTNLGPRDQFTLLKIHELKHNVEIGHNTQKKLTKSQPPDPSGGN
jgi:hypothetical protein